MKPKLKPLSKQRPVPCPRCYAPMTDGVCKSQGCLKVWGR